MRKTRTGEGEVVHWSYLEDLERDRQIFDTNLFGLFLTSCREIYEDILDSKCKQILKISKEVCDIKERSDDGVQRSDFFGIFFSLPGKLLTRPRKRGEIAFHSKPWINQLKPPFSNSSGGVN